MYENMRLCMCMHANMCAYYISVCGLKPDHWASKLYYYILVSTGHLFTVLSIIESVSWPEKSPNIKTFIAACHKLKLRSCGLILGKIWEEANKY